VSVFGQVDPQTPLQAYCKRPEPAYSWSIHNVVRGSGFDTYVVNLTSVNWLTPADSNAYTWSHWLEICVPHKQTKGAKIQAGIYADGGGQGDQAPTKGDSFAGIIAVRTGQLVAHLHQIPNQPIYFTAEKPTPKRRVEDQLIAYTWSHFLNHTDQPEWLARLPMVKSVVKAMDCMQEFSLKHGFGQIDGFVIAGASKRGWTTWLTPVVDPRVLAIVPIVMPVLNMQAVINKLWRSLGEWSFALDDYQALNLMDYLNTPEFGLMADIIDPFIYKATMTRIPKYLLIASGDEFFIPDATRDFWKDLPGNSNHLRVIPNSEHSMINHAYTVLEQVATFVNMFNAEQLPEPLNYTMIYSNTTAAIVIHPKTKLSLVTMYQAHTLSGTQRDFRLLTCGRLSPECLNPVWWSGTTLTPEADGSYTAAIRAPHIGWIGFLIEVTYLDPQNPSSSMQVSTEVNIVPDVYPFPPCGGGKGCL